MTAVLFEKIFLQLKFSIVACDVCLFLDSFLTKSISSEKVLKSSSVLSFLLVLFSQECRHTLARGYKPVSRRPSLYLQHVIHLAYRRACRTVHLWVHAHHTDVSSQKVILFFFSFQCGSKEIPLPFIEMSRYELNSCVVFWATYI